MRNCKEFSIRLCVYDKGSNDIYSEFFAASYVKNCNYESVIFINTRIKSENTSGILCSYE
jgi:hypothetical protein